MLQKQRRTIKATKRVPRNSSSNTTNTNSTTNNRRNKAKTTYMLHYNDDSDSDIESV